MEKFIKTVSSFFAVVIIYFLVGGFYLQSKGFVPDPENVFVLARPAQAAQKAKKTIPDNYAFPDQHVLGNKNAPVTLYEYSSFTCTHCATFHLQTLPKIKDEFVDKGLLKVVFVPLPLDKNSMDAALLAECVGDDKYFDFINVLFKNQGDWSLSFHPQKSLIQYAVFSGVNKDMAEACLKNDANAEVILTNRQNGLADIGISGTPSFVVSSKKGNELVEGYKSFDDFKEIINKHSEF